MTDLQKRSLIHVNELLEKTSDFYSLSSQVLDILKKENISEDLQNKIYKKINDFISDKLIPIHSAKVWIESIKNDK